ncbi:MAG: OFA family MFS transporter [Gammaproteobacteria bacterium]
MAHDMGINAITVDENHLGPKETISAVKEGPYGKYRDITDKNGRVFRMGEDPGKILHAPRVLMIWLPWVTMMGIGISEYGFGAASGVLKSVNGWSMTETFWLISVWVLLEALVSFPTGILRERGIIPVRAAMWTGAILSFLAFIILGFSHSIGMAFLGFSIFGGIGAGMVYSTCVNIASKWYPERRGAKTGFIDGGFGYGVLPFLFVFTYWFHKSDYALVLGIIAVELLLNLGICGFFMKDPPKSWWPAHINPLTWATDPHNKAAKLLRKNPPAIQQMGPMAALKTGMLPIMWITLVIASGVGLFGSNYEVGLAKSLHFGPLIAAASMGLLAIVNGGGRALSGWLSDVMGRKDALILILLIEGLAQFGVIFSGNAHILWLFLVFALFSGLGGGAFYTLFAAMVPDYFGENNNAKNYGIVYSGKVIGGVVAGGAAASLVVAEGFTVAYIIAGCLGILSAIIAVFLRQPGRSRVAPSPMLSEEQVVSRAA